MKKKQIKPNNFADLRIEMQSLGPVMSCLHVANNLQASLLQLCVTSRPLLKQEYMVDANEMALDRTYVLLAIEHPACVAAILVNNSYIDNIGSV
jgi:hypothetical protein